MRVVVTSDRLNETDPVTATKQLVAGWLQSAPDDIVVPFPGSDGGPGFISCVAAATAATTLTSWTTAQAVVTAAPLTVWVQAATCADNLAAVLNDALNLEPARVVVAVGGTLPPDSGDKLLRGWGLLTDKPPTADPNPNKTTPVQAQLTGLKELRTRWANTELVVAFDEDRPLLGMAGLAGIVADEHGPAAAQELSTWLTAVVIAADTVDPGPLDLLALPGRGQASRLAQTPGAGAGGGLGFAVALAGGRLQSGAEVLGELGLDAQIDQADLVVVGTPVLDWDTAVIGLCGQVAHRASENGTPVVVLADSVVVGRRDLAGTGLMAAYPLTGSVGEVSARVARTWSPRW